MARPSISVVVPTVGRVSLLAALWSIASQMGPEDEALVSGDGPQPDARAMTALFGPRFRYIESDVRANDWGATPRNAALALASRDAVAFMDDDDVYLPGALDAIRSGLKACPGRPLVFRMRHRGRILWDRPELSSGNVSTQMFAVPNIPGLMGRWTTRYEGDYDFIFATAALYPPGSVVFREEVIAELREHATKPPAAGTPELAVGESNLDKRALASSNGVVARTEMEKIRPRIQSLLDGRSVLDLGPGVEKVCPWAVGVDHASPAADLKADVSPQMGQLSSALRGRSFDVVFSSHCLEHVSAPVLETLRHWLSFVRPGGVMVLYLPDERVYRYDPGNPKRRNPDHRHFLTMDTFVWYVEQMEPACEMIEMSQDFGPDRHSFLCVLKRAGP